MSPVPNVVVDIVLGPLLRRALLPLLWLLWTSPRVCTSTTNHPLTPTTSAFRLSSLTGIAKASTRTLKRKFSVSHPSNSPLKRSGASAGVDRNPEDAYDTTSFSIRDDEARDKSQSERSEIQRGSKRPRSGEESEAQSTQSETQGSQSGRESKKRRLGSEGFSAALSSPLKKGSSAVDGLSSSFSSISSPLKKLRSGVGSSLPLSMSMSVSVDEESRRLSRSASNESLGLISSLAVVEAIELGSGIPTLLQDTYYS